MKILNFVYTTRSSRFVNGGCGVWNICTPNGRPSLMLKIIQKNLWMTCYWVQFWRWCMVLVKLVKGMGRWSGHWGWWEGGGGGGAGGLYILVKRFEITSRVGRGSGGGATDGETLLLCTIFISLQGIESEGREDGSCSKGMVEEVAFVE